MNRKLLAAVMMGSLVLCASTFAAQGKPVASKTSAAKSVSSTTHQISGTVMSSSANSLVISHKFKGSPENMTFMLDPQTKTSGTLGPGAQATIKYRVDGKENVALDVAAKSPSQRKSAKATY